jgi:hypothetical protein
MNGLSKVEGRRSKTAGCALFNLRPSTLNRRKGFALIEVLVAVLFIAIFMLVLLQIRNQALYQFIVSGDQHTGAWLAEMKMTELVSQDLPDPADDTTWMTSGGGDFGDFDDRVNDLNRDINEDWVERSHFAKFEYEWTKELLFIGPNFIGNKEDLDLWEQPLDETTGEAVEGEDDPMEQPAARIVRITLTVFMPEPRARADDDKISDEEAEARRKRPSVKLVTYVDPATLFEAEAATEEPPPEG